MKELNADTFSAWFRYHVHISRLSKSRLAFLLHCSRYTLGKWERGDKIPDETQLEIIKRIFGVKDAEEFNIPCPSSWEPSTIDGCTIDEWRKRALIAERKLRLLNDEIARNDGLSGKP